MPIYSYKCENFACKHEFSVLCKFEEDWHPCPECLFPDTKRQLSAPNFTLKKGPYDSYL